MLIAAGGVACAVLVADNAESNDNDAKVKTFSMIDYNGNIIVTYAREQIVKNKMSGKFQLLNQKTSFSYNIKGLEDYMIFKVFKKLYHQI